MVDDERAVRESIGRSLKFEGYEVELAADGIDALAQIISHPPDAVVLDVQMPRLNGLELCRRLRSSGLELPVLMLTSRQLTGDRVAGLDAGADDYLTKPFSLDELFARLRAVLRRPRLDPAVTPAGTSTTVTFADLELDPVTREATRAGTPLRLTRTEFHLLSVFMSEPRRVFSRSQLVTAVWGAEVENTSNSLDVYIGYLRRKTEAGGGRRLLHTVHAVGYCLREPR